MVLAQRGDRTMLESRDALKTLAANLSKAVPPKPTEPRQDPLQEVAKQFGLPPEEIDKAIRAWGSRAEDPFEKGLAALYERNYPVATQRLEESLDQRETTLKQDQNAAADAAFFLGNALYDQGRYRDANARYQRAAELRPDDAAVLNNWGICLMTTAQYDKADQLLRRALVMAESSQGPDHPDTGTRLNLALLLEAKGDYAGAEPFLRRALAIAEKSHGPDHPTTGTTLNNLAVLLLARKGLRGRRTPLPPGPRDRGKVPRARPPRHRRVP